MSSVSHATISTPNSILNSSQDQGDLSASLSIDELRWLDATAIIDASLQVTPRRASPILSDDPLTFTRARDVPRRHNPQASDNSITPMNIISKGTDASKAKNRPDLRYTLVSRAVNPLLFISHIALPTDSPNTRAHPTTTISRLPIPIFTFKAPNPPQYPHENALPASPPSNAPRHTPAYYHHYRHLILVPTSIADHGPGTTDAPAASASPRVDLSPPKIPRALPVSHRLHHRIRPCGGARASTDGVRTWPWP